MPYTRPLTDEELDQVNAGALGQLADAHLEYEKAHGLLADQSPSLELARSRFNAAKDSMRTSLAVFNAIQEEIEQRYRTGNPV
jgi:hypothetical protein